MHSVKKNFSLSLNLIEIDQKKKLQKSCYNRNEQQHKKSHQPERVTGIIIVRPDTSDTGEPHSSQNWCDTDIIVPPIGKCKDGFAAFHSFISPNFLQILHFTLLCLLHSALPFIGRFLQ